MNHQTRSQPCRTGGIHVAEAAPPTEVAPVIGDAPLCFLGRRTLSKLYLMLHFGRMLTQCGQVRMDTVNLLVGEETVYDHNGIEVHEYPDEPAMQAALAACWTGGLPGARDILQGGAFEQEGEHGKAILVGAAQCQSIPSYHLVDLADAFSLPATAQVLLILDPDRNTVDSGFALLAGTGALSGRFVVHRVYLDLCESSRIGARYLEGLLMRHLPPLAVLGEWYALVMEERNQGAMLDNQHEDLLRLGRLSPSYHTLLKELANKGFGISRAMSARCIRMADKDVRRNHPMNAEIGR